MSDSEQAVPSVELLEAIGELLAVRRRARRSLVIGLVIAIVAGLVSLGSYAAADAAAQTDPTAGAQTYYILWGAVAFGVFKAGRAARALFHIRKVLKP
jgi:hypothetical protein